MTIKLFTAVSRIRTISEIRILLSIRHEAKPISVISEETGVTESALGKTLARLRSWITIRKFDAENSPYQKSHNPPHYEFIVSNLGALLLDEEMSEYDKLKAPKTKGK